MTNKNQYKKIAISTQTYEKLLLLTEIENKENFSEMIEELMSGRTITL